MERKKQHPMEVMEDQKSGKAAFSKRRKGLMKKARELSVLCDVDVALFVKSDNGHRYEFACGDSLAKIAQRYNNCPNAKGKVVTASSDAETGSSSHKTCFELLQTVEKELEEPYVNQLDVLELLQLEEEISVALAHTRSMKSQLTIKPVVDLQEKDMELQEENNCLNEELAASKTGGGDEEVKTCPHEQ